jgi:hypothetical protein
MLTTLPIQEIRIAGLYSDRPQPRELPLVSLAARLLLALLAETSPGGLVNVGVLGRELVIANAMSLIELEVPSVPLDVPHVLQLRIPPEVSDMVVSGVAIVVATDQAVRSRADEGLQNEDVDLQRFAAAISVQRSLEVSVISVLLQSEDAASSYLLDSIAADHGPVEAADAPMVADLIETFESRNGAPDFVRLAHVEPPVGFGHDPGRAQSVAGFFNPRILLAGTDIKRCAA